MNNYQEEKQKLAESLKKLKLTDSVSKAEKTLNSHIGFKREKATLLNHITLYIITKGDFWPEREVIVFVASAGTGKTTFVQKIALAQERPLESISFAGSKGFDDFSILGDKKKPSLVAWAIKKNDCKNPVILLDELEKVEEGDQIQKDLIELFERYKKGEKFIDPYYQEEINLAHVTFFATVNEERLLSLGLKPVVSMQELEDYDQDEKIEILQIKRAEKQKKHGLEEEFVSDESIEFLVKKHINEGGVRKLDQALSKMAEEYVLAKQENRTPFQGSQEQWIKQNIFPYQESFKIRWPHHMLYGSLTLSFFLIITWIFKKFLLKKDNNK